MMDAKKISFMGIFLSVSLVLSYLESLIPFFFGIPGMKLGLSNALVMILLYLYGIKECALVNILRIIITGMLFGNAFSVVYSLSGALFSLLVMVLLKKTLKPDIAVNSICGGMAHNAGQLLIAALLFGSPYLLYYLPFLLLFGFASGGLIGIISRGCLFKIKRE